MTYPNKSLVTLLMLFLLVDVRAEPSAVLKEGKYVRAGGDGWLTIDGGSFTIESLGGNCHTCTVSGYIEKGIGHPGGDESENNGACRISFAKKNSNLNIQATDGCNYYCGMRAGFIGDYKISPSTCTEEARKSRHDLFDKQYQMHDFVSAKQTIKSLYSECKDFMYWIEVDQLRNDLAITQLQEGRPKECLTTLSETLASQYKNQEALKGNMPPCDYDNYSQVAQITFDNVALCNK